jgi:ketosteroid isomerase-like protein
VSDRGDICELVARFADAVNRLDLAAFEYLWTPEATWIIDPPTDYRSRGSRAEITAGFDQGMRGHWRSFSQYVHGTVVDFEPGGDAASVRSYLSEIGIPLEGDGGYSNHGTYIDRVERTAEGWRFRERHYRYLYLDGSTLHGEGAPLGGPQ